MNITATRIPGVLLLEPNVFADDRGFFLETYHKQTYSDRGINVDFVQDNQSRSTKGVLRGLHYQLDNPQGKLVSVVTGAVFDVAVDIRVGSPTFGDWVGYELSDQNHLQLYIPPGFAHGFCVIADTADFLYKCTDFYAPADEYGIHWNDPALGIQWPGEGFSISAKDANNKSLSEMEKLLPVYRESI